MNAHDRRFRPPRLSRLLIALAAPGRERADVLADLDDEAARVAAAGGARAARVWYRRQVRRSLAPLLRRRLTVPAAALGAGLRQDVRLAIRSLASAPGFALAVVLMLAAGIGAHTVAYSVLDGLLFRPLPFGPASDRLVTLHSIHPTLATDWDDAEMSYPDLQDFGSDRAVLEAIEGAIGRSVSVSHEDRAERILAASVTPGLFNMLGVKPALGRGFTAPDAAPPGFEQVVLIGHPLWESMFGADPRAVGGTLHLNGRPLTVIGVMPRGFAFPDEQQLWLPYRPDDTVTGRGNRSLLAIGLLAPGVSQDAAVAALKTTAARLASAYPDTNRDWSVHLLPIRAFFVNADDAGTLVAAVTLLLLVACANVAGLMVARGLGRARELGVRAALGAGRFRLLRLLVVEGLVLAIGGGALGLAFASWGVRALVAWIPEPPPYWAVPAFDLRVATFGIVVTALVALLAAVLPAIRLARADASGALLPGARAASITPSHRRTQRGLVVGQVALSLTLLVTATLLGRSASALHDADGGFDRSHLLSLRFYIAGDRYDDSAARAAAVEAVVQRVSAIGGVRAAAATGSIPTDDGGTQIRLVVPAGAAGAFDEIGAQLVPVTPSFWDALRLSIASGRGFTASEAMDAETPSIVVNRRLAARLWPKGEAVGRELPVRTGSGEHRLRVVGVAPDLVYEEFGEETDQSQLIVYVPYIRAGWRTQAVLVSTHGTPAAVADQARAAIRAVDSGFAVYDVLTMDDRRAYNHWGDMFVGRTFSTLAIAALLLACVGAYGIATYGVQQQRQEIALRMAIGASRRDVLRQFLAGGVRLAVLGIAIGLPLAGSAARILEGELFRVSAWEIGPWVTLPAVLVAAVLSANYLPARRASLVDPARILRG